MALSTDPFDLSLLPPPNVVEELDFEVIFQRQRQKFAEVWAAVRAANPELVLPDYDVELLETDPAVIGSQSESYRETVLRARINDAARANLLAFARDGDLEQLGAFYGVFRMLNENDDRFAVRIILAIQGRSTGGTVPRYKYVAMTSDIAVADVDVYTVGKSPLIHVSVFSTAPDGVASPALISKVTEALNAPGVIMVNDTIEVASAVQRVIEITADAWLLPEASLDVLETAEDNLRAAWAKTRGLGRDLTVSWWMSRLMVSGIQRVVPLSPMADEVAHPYEALALGEVTLNYRGRAY